MSNQREVFSRNLNKLIEKKGIDQRILADYLGVSEMAVSNWVNGIKYPRMGNIQKMADYFGVLKSDLIEDKGNKRVSTASQYNYFPATISAGLPSNVDGIELDDVEKITIPDSLMGKHARSNDIYFIRVNGESMNKVIPNGSLIAVKSVNLSSLHEGDIVVYSDGNDYSVKRYFKQNDKIIFRPDSRDNSFYDYITSTDNQELKIHGKVVVYVVELD